MNTLSTPIRLAAFWLHILGQMFTPFEPRPRCAYGCGFGSRDAREMAAHLYVEHAGDRKVRDAHAH